MSGRFDFNAQHVALSLLALLMSILLGVMIPVLQDDGLGISRPSQGRAATATLAPSAAAETATVAPSPPAAVLADLNAAGGALLAWQEPVPATPTSTVIASPAPSLTASPTGGGSARAAVLPAVRPAADPPDGALTQPVSSTEVSASLSAQNTAVPASSNAPSPLPSPTLLPTRAPVPPKNPPAPRPAVAAAATPAPVAALPQRVAPPALLAPALEDRRRGEVRFEWLPTSELPRGAAYELVVWSPDQDPNQAWGVAPPRSTPSLTLNLDELFRSGRFLTGNLYWTVLVVEQNPYRRLTQPAESEQRYLVYASEGAATDEGCCSLSR